MLQNTASIYGIPRHVDPAIGLIEEYWRTAGIVAGLETRVAELHPEELTWGVAEIADFESAASEDGDGRPARQVKKRSGLNALVKLFNEERDRFAKLGVEIVRLGLEARRDEYIRAQVEVFARVLLSPELSLSEGQRETAARLLRNLEGEKIIEGRSVDS
jgi:hypothetical protein